MSYQEYRTAEEFAAALCEQVMQILKDTPPRVPNAFAGEKLIAKAFADACEALAPAEIEVSLGPQDEETRRERRLSFDLKMSREVYDRVFVGQLGYAPISPSCIEITVTVET